MQTQANRGNYQGRRADFIRDFGGAMGPLYADIYADIFCAEPAAKAPAPKRRKAVRRRVRRVALLDFIVGRGGEVVDVRMVGRPTRRVRR